MPVQLADSYESIYQRAITQMGLGNADDAIDLMLRIVNRLRKLRPETLERKADLQNMLILAWRNAVVFLRWEKRYDQAIAVCESVLDRLPDPDAARRRVASLTIEKGEVEEGIARLKELAEAKPSFAAWSDLGAEYAALGRYDEAKACYRSALALAGSNEDAALANVALFELYQETGRLQDALDAWSMATVLDPELGEQVHQLYGWLIDRGELEQAAKYLRREQDPIRRAFYEGLIDWQSGREAAARTKWHNVLGTEVEQASQADAWVRAALYLGEPERAIEWAEAPAARGLLTATDALVAVGIAHAMLGQLDAAQAWFDRALLNLERAWPSRDSIPAAKWALLTSLVSDQEVLRNLAHLFEESEGKG
jgi:tetratricopeptide (TPR) repeat protein